MSELIGADRLFHLHDFAKLMLRLSIDLVTVSILVLGIYWRRYRNRDNVFTFVTINLVTFLFCFMLRNVSIELGFALGLFAVFGILRYRTEPISTRDLTYLFLCIGMAILNAVGINKKTSLAESLLADAMVVGVAAALEALPLPGRGGARPILYDHLALLAPGREAELHADLTARTGLPVERVRVDRLDLLRDAAEITVTFAEPAPQPDPAPRSDPAA